MLGFVWWWSLVSVGTHVLEIQWSLTQRSWERKVVLPEFSPSANALVQFFVIRLISYQMKQDYLSYIMTLTFAYGVIAQSIQQCTV